MRSLVGMCLFIGAAAASGQPMPAIAGSELWREIGSAVELARFSADPDLPRHYRRLHLETSAFESRIASLTGRRSGGSSGLSVLMELPLPEGGFQSFSIGPTSVMAPELAARYPEIQAYSGTAVDDPRIKVRLDWTPLGLHAMVFSPQHLFYIDPGDRNEPSSYLSFYSEAAKRGVRSQIGSDVVGRPASGYVLDQLRSGQQGIAIGDQLRSYRLAVATTSGYTRSFGGTKAKGLAAVVTAVNRVNLILEQELALRLQLVAENDDVVFVDKDPYGDLRNGELLARNQRVLDEIIGSGNYDIGHLFLNVPAGLAHIQSVCAARFKAAGLTGASRPERDAFWVDYVAHEIGHQLGADHTFNGTKGSCGAQREPTSAYESGSGVTIMGYAGICGNDDIAQHSIPFFHARSLEQITRNVRFGMGNQCGIDTPTGLAPPIVDAGAGEQTIPMQTPFHLSGSGTDPGGHPLSFSWEQYDLGGAATLAETRYQLPELGAIPLFRSFAPQAAAGHDFPRLRDILKGRSSNKAVLPGYSRELSFRLTVRNGLGGVASSGVRKFFVTDAAGPFTVKQPGKRTLWKSNGWGSVTWNVARTDRPPVSCGAVTVDLSTDGGKSFAVRLAEGTPNDGQVVVGVPSLETERARVRVTCSDSIFGDISDGDFSITP